MGIKKAGLKFNPGLTLICLQTTELGTSFSIVCWVVLRGL